MRNLHLGILALSVVLGGCSTHSHFGMWNTENRLRDAFWNEAFQDGKTIPGPALVMPLVNCAKDDSSATRNEQVRKLWPLTFSKELWKRLKQTGEPKTLKRAEADAFCGELLKSVDVEDWEISAVVKEAITHALAKDPSKKSLAISLWAPQIAWRDYANGTRKVWETGDAETRVYLFSAQGEMIYRGTNVCGPGGGDINIRCDANFKQAPEAVQFMFKWFPSSVLGG